MNKKTRLIFILFGLCVMLFSIEPDTNQLSHGFIIEYWGWWYIWEIIDYQIFYPGLIFTIIGLIPWKESQLKENGGENVSD